ncbi:MAG: LptF/LptG family permease [Rhodobacteraceae bacterium]|nr:LptF/LptG family permease [Paracoccaceae bacterium]
MLLLSTLDRYILSRLIVLFMLFTLVLAGAYWVNLSVRSLRIVITNIQSFQTFAELSMWFLLRSVMIVMPLTGFIAAIYTAIHFHTSREQAAIYSTGMPFSTIVRPYVIFATLICLLSLSYAHFFGPISRAEISALNYYISHNFSIGSTHTGRFNFPDDELAVFVEGITEDQKLTDIIVFENPPEGLQAVHFAESAYILRAADSIDIVMLHGQSLLVNPETRSIANVNFDDLSVGVAAFIESAPERVPELRELTSDRLQDEEGLEEAGLDFQSIQIWLETQVRNSDGLLAFVLAVLGAVSCHSLIGLGRGPALTCLITALAGICAFLATEFLHGVAAKSPAMWPALYAASGVALLLTVFLAARLHYDWQRR